MFKKVQPKLDFPKIELKILDFWKKNKIFEKSLKKKSPKGDFVFYDGPPFATGTPHYGHLVASLMKDIVPRYQTMQGYHVERRWGWDCHGLPIENIVEEELGLKSKKDIENIGIDKFNETCRSKVLIYAKEWKKIIERLGRWVDMDNPYKTMDLDFMESIWWVFKQLWDKGLIYKGYKSMHICPRCETTLSQSEVAQGYKDIKDLAVTVKFELKDEPGTFVLAWTTTPWTLIGNVALAVGKNINYLKFSLKNYPSISDGIYITSKKDFEDYKMEIKTNEAKDKDIKVEILQRLKGKDLIGKRYQPVFDYYLNKDLENKENLYTIQSADFVDVEEGTGIVHIAPAFGEDDMNLGREKNLPFIQHVKMDGRFKKDVLDFAGLEVKPKNDPLATDRKIIEYLKNKDLLFFEEEYVHSYPHCWRCESPLLNYAASSWFVKVTALKDKMLKRAKDINWVPRHVKKGRFGKWLEGVKDWSISRQRFWGSVIPIWVCHKCGEKKVIGSIKELEKLSGKKITDLHKHFVDKIEFECEKCGGRMKRIPDVLDCWFESGSMPYAQIHYPFENKEKFEKNFPAQYIAEGVDQTRCWFYYLHVLSTAIKNKQAFRNVIANGIVLAEDGKKMSKRLGNYPEPSEIFDKYGADAVRYYLATSQVMKAEDLRFSEKEVDEVFKKVILILLNVFSFYKIFAEGLKVEDLKPEDLDNILDKWINSKLERLKHEITKAYDNYDLIKATKPLEDFINILSTWYVRRSRNRFKGQDKDGKIKALKTLRRVLFHLSRVMAPVMPFTAEHIYQELNGRLESVHLEDWPKVNKELINRKLEEKMQLVRDIVALGMSLRVENEIKVKQPLSKLQVTKSDKDFLELIKDELNVKEVLLVEKIEKGLKTKKEKGLEVGLDIKITPELKQEGIARELIRHIQNMRKQADYNVSDQIVTSFQLPAISKQLKEVFKNFGSYIKEETLSLELKKQKEKVDVEKEIEIDGIKVWLGVKK